MAGSATTAPPAFSLGGEKKDAPAAASGMLFFLIYSRVLMPLPPAPSLFGAAPTSKEGEKKAAAPASKFQIRYFEILPSDSIRSCALIRSFWCKA